MMVDSMFCNFCAAIPQSSEIIPLLNAMTFLLMPGHPPTDTLT